MTNNVQKVKYKQSTVISSYTASITKCSYDGPQYFHDSKSVVFNPSILSDKSVHNFLHSQIWDELVLGQFLACYRVKVTHPL